MKQTLSIFAVIMMALALPHSAWAYDFSAVAPSGQTLYYNIVGDHAEVVRPGASSDYNNYVTGDLVIPYEVTYGGSTYTVTALVRGGGYGTFEGCSGLTSVDIPDGVTYIGEYAFSCCSGLTSVDIPDGVTTIGSQAFYNCSGLTSITIGYGVTSIGSQAFYNCSGLTSVTIPDGVTSIGSNAFSYCRGLTSVTIGDGVTSIGSKVFNSCSGLTSIVVEEGNTHYDSRENCNAIIETSSNILIAGCQNTVIPNTVTAIGNNAFYGCTGLTSIDIPDGVTTIGSEAFRDCIGLTSVTIPDGVTYIGGFAFHNCIGLTSVTIPDGVTYIGYYAFYDVRHIEYHGTASGSPWGGRSMNGVTEGEFVYTDATKCYLIAYIGTGGDVTIPTTVTTIVDSAFVYCTGLTSVTIPDGVTSIGNSAFMYCTGLTSVTIGSGVTSIDDATFWQCSCLTSVSISNGVSSIGNSAFGYCSSLTSITIPASVTSIGDFAFYGCNSLTSVDIPDGVTSIGYGTFYGCSGLTSVDIPDGVTTIGDYAFEGCSGLTSVTIGDGVSSIGNYAFEGCSGLTSLYCLATTPPTIGSSLFSKNCPIYVPCESVADYQTEWNNYSSRIHGTPNFDFTYTFAPGNDTMGSVTVGAVDCDSNVTVTATANTGYQFIGWSDGVTVGSRTVHLTGDTMVTALFDYITYAVIGQPNNAARGTVTGSDTVYYGDTVTLTATANYGYHFTQWSDGNTNNPRAVVVTANRTFTAYFYANTYTVAVHSADSTQGSVSGSGTSNYLSNRYINAIPATGYHFSHWSDGDSNASRYITVTQDTVLTAYFEINTYQLTVLPNDSTLGSVTGGGIYPHGTEVTVTATPSAGNRFDRWSDYTLLTSRTVTLTGNLQLVAVFVPVDSVFVHDTTIVHDTSYVDVHDTTYIDIHDTTYVDVPYPVHDTTYIDVHDTTYVPVHDTTYITLTETDTLWLWQYDTIYIHDSVYLIQIDTVTNTVYDTVTNTVYDTVTNTIYDTITNTIYDTTLVTVTDTLWMPGDTVYITLTDTVYIYDTVYVGVDDVEPETAKIYISGGQIVVEGAEGNAVALYDVNGRLLATRQDRYTSLRFDVPASGAYLVRIGDRPARRVVVIR